jgi:phosphoribosylformimino-5-aminoimidazole carboxamide ribotide isomerase
MLIIPAIDIRGGRCVRLIQGDFDQETTYGDDPVAMARRWKDEGAQLIHVVDLDGAKDGTAGNLPAITRIVAEVAVPIEVGGGIRTPRYAQKLLDAGVSRVIIGTMAFEDRPALEELLVNYAPRVVVAIETKNGDIVTRGWQRTTGGDLCATALELQELGVQRILYTDVGRDGMLTEPNYKDIETLQNALKVPIIASGGVSTVASVAKLAEMGVEAAIVGKALYEGTVKLGDLQNAS